MLRIAVYGSLKRGGLLNGHMVNMGAQFHSEIRLDGFRMYALKSGAFPAVVRDPAGTITAEIWDLPDTTALLWLDRIEGCPHLYRREAIEPRFFIYVWAGPIEIDRFGAEVPDGNWDAETRAREFIAGR